MGGGIEMHGVHDVLEARQRTLGHQVDVLIPVRTAHQHDVVGVVLANLANHLGGILLQVLPGVFHRLVVYLVDHVRIFAVLLGHASEEVLGLLCLHVVRVPVDDDIDVLLDGRLDDRGHTLHGVGGILQIVVFYQDAHGGTHHRAVPVLFQRLHHLLIIEAGPQVVPAQTHTAQNDGASLLVAQLGAIHLQLTPFLDGVLRLYTQRANA